MRAKHVLAAAAAVLGLSGVAGPAMADRDADRCGGAKTVAAAKYAKAVFACEGTALRKDEPVATDCRTRALERLAAAFDKAEAAGGCTTSGDESAAAADVESALAAALALLDPDPAPEARTCDAAKLSGSGGHLRRTLTCFGKSALGGRAPTAACLDKASSTLATAFAKAEARGACSTTGDVGDFASASEAGAHETVRGLSPFCGDALVGPSQECDGDEAPTCPGLCDASCACDFPAVCGDGVAKLPEECDDGDLDDGDGCSAACLLEDASALCAGIATSSGTAIDAVLVSDDFEVPLYLTAPPLDPTRLFVVERAGFIRVVNLADDSVNPTPFLDISALTTTGGERGFLSMAFDPDYEANGRFFVSYTNLDGDLVLARYEVDAGDEDLADPSTRQELLVVPHPGAANHNGGQLQFGDDGYLYWSMGDGGSGVNAQDDASMLGKMLRLDVDHDAAPFVTVPPTNPGYAGGLSDLEYVWAKGLRNPWRFSFDRGTGDLYIGDVGASLREEVSWSPAPLSPGANYGWKIFEGNRCNEPSCPEPPTGFTMPVHDYTHLEGCAVIGGYVYRGCAMPDVAGTYFFSDLCTKPIRSLEVVGGVAVDVADRTDDARSAGATFAGVNSWGQDARGELYVINGNNSIYRIEAE